MSMTANDSSPALWRAWVSLVWLSFRRQANARQMVWIALALVGVTAAGAAINTAAGYARPESQGWGMHPWRWPDSRPGGKRPPMPFVRMRYSEWVDRTHLMLTATPLAPEATALQAGILGSVRTVLTPNLTTTRNQTVSVSGFQIFSELVISSLFLTFLLPLCSLSFAVESIGGDRESQNLIWLLSRPMPRPLIYLAKFVALLPWAIGLNLGGFALICLAGGAAGRPALTLYWPAILLVTVAFSSLFILLGAWFRRPAIVGLIYSFCLELVLGGMPGYLKYLSISYYARCLMFRRAESAGILAGDPIAYLSDERVAFGVLLLVTTALLGLGMWIFSRKQYHEVD
jgi:ABC-type transport system involved in multi-copper enzyme maturation permease subunit